jgi:hypothetical protein
MNDPEEDEDEWRPSRECLTEPGHGDCLWYGACQETLPTCPLNRRTNNVFLPTMRDQE